MYLFTPKTPKLIGKILHHILQVSVKNRFFAQTAEKAGAIDQPMHVLSGNC